MQSFINKSHVLKYTEQLLVFRTNYCWYIPKASESSEIHLPFSIKWKKYLKNGIFGGRIKKYLRIK